MASTPKKFFKVIKYTPKTKNVVCVLCGNRTEKSDYRRKLFHGSVKTESCIIIEKYLDIDITPDLHTDTVCRKCLREVQKVDGIVSKLKTSYKNTIGTLQETHGQESLSYKRQYTTCEDDSNTKRKALFKEGEYNPDENIEESFLPIEVDNEHIQVIVIHGLTKSVHLIKPFYLPLIDAIATDDVQKLGIALQEIPSLNVYMEKNVEQKLKNEIKTLSSKQTNSVLRKTDKDSLKTLKLNQILDEWISKAPTFLRLLETCISNPSQKRNKYKKDDALLPGIITAGCKLLSIYNQELNVFQHLNSVILLKGGCKKSAFARLNTTYDCLTYQAALNISDKFGEDWNEDLIAWAQQVLEGVSVEESLLSHIKEIKDDINMLNGNPEITMELIIELSETETSLEKHRASMHPGFYFIGDNVDMRTNVRHMTMYNQSKDQHMYQICAYENRVSGNHLDNTVPKADINAVPFNIFLPETPEKISSDFAFIVAWQWALHIPCFNVYATVLPSHIEHVYMKEMKQKSKRINMGVLKKSEQYNEDMTDICEFMHEFVPGHNISEDWTKKPEKVLSGGDYLTFERHKQAQSSKRNGRTPTKRLEGLIPKMEEFHNQGELLTVIWKLLYSTASAPDQGTLYAARNTINARNVTHDPSAHFYASSDLIEKVTKAYIVAGGLSYFNMDNLDSHPTQNMYTGQIGDSKEMCAYLLRHANIFVEQFTNLKVRSLPDYGPQNNTYKCRYCAKSYKKPKALRKHEATIHSHYDPLFSLDKSTTQSKENSNEDGVLNYTKLCLTLGLIRLDHNDAIHMGDGERIMRINHYLMLYYKACHCTKYTYGILETLSQAKVLLTERLAHRLIWNRTVNHRGELNTNHPNDLDVEHCNKIFKDEAHSYRGVFTEKTVSRVSRSALTLHNIVKQFDKMCDVSTTSGKHTVADLESDIIILTNQFKQLQLFSSIPGRSHRAFPDMDSNPLSSLDMEALRDWISLSLKKFSRKHFYRV